MHQCGVHKQRVSDVLTVLCDVVLRQLSEERYHACDGVALHE